MLMKEYRQLYSRILGYSFSWALSIISALIAGGLAFVSLLYVRDAELVLKSIPSILFFLHVIAIFMEDPKKGNMGHLFSFLKTTPLRKATIIRMNYVCKVINLDQMLLYAAFILVFLLCHVAWTDTLILFTRLFIMLFIAQTIEYVYIFYKEKFLYHFAFPVLLLVISLLVSNANQLQYHIQVIFSHYFDIILISGFVLTAIICPIIVSRLLVAKKNAVPATVIQLSRAISKISRIYVMPLQWRSLMGYQLLAYIRNIQILSKYALIASLTVAYSTFSYMLQENTNTSINFMVMAYIMSIYFFSEIRLNFLLEKHSLLRFFSVSTFVETRIVQSCGLLFVCLFGSIGFIYRYMLIDISIIVLAKSLLYLICCYLIGTRFRISSPPDSKIHRLKLVALYSALCLMALVLIYNFHIIIDVFIIIAFGWQANRKRNKREEITWRI